MYSVRDAKYKHEGSVFSPVQSLMYSITEQLYFNINEDTDDKKDDKKDNSSGNPISNFFKKIGEWFKKIWEKIKGIFKKTKASSAETKNASLPETAKIKIYYYETEFNAVSTFAGKLSGVISELNTVSNIAKGAAASNVIDTLKKLISAACTTIGNIPNKAGTTDAKLGTNIDGAAAEALNKVNASTEFDKTKLSEALSTAQTAIEGGTAPESTVKEEEKTVGEVRGLCRKAEQSFATYEEALSRLSSSIVITNDAIARAITEYFVYNYGSYRVFVEEGGYSDEDKKKVNAYGTALTEILSMLFTLVLKTTENACTHFNDMANACGYAGGRFPVYALATK